MSADVSFLVPAVNAHWFEPIGNETLFSTALQKARTCEDIGPVFAAVSPQAKSLFDAAAARVRDSITPLPLKETRSGILSAELQLYIDAVQSMPTPWLAALRPFDSTFFDPDVFKFARARAEQKKYTVAMSWPWVGWQIVLLHRSMLPNLLDWHQMLQQPYDSTLALTHIFSLLQNRYGSLHDDYYAEYVKREGQPYDNGCRYFAFCGPGSLDAYRKVTQSLGVPLSGLDVKTVANLLRSNDVLKGGIPQSVWVEISSVNDVPPIYSPIRHSKKPDSYPAYMSPKIFERLIALLREDIAMGRELHLTGLGEPLQNPAYPAFLKLINDSYRSGVIPNVHCYTDGRLLTEQISGEIVRGAVNSVMISMDAVDEPHYKTVRPEGDFSLVKRNFERLLELKRAKKPHPAMIGMAPVLALTTALIAELEDHIDAFMSAYMTGSRWIKRYGKNLSNEAWPDAIRAYYKDGHAVEYLVIQGASTFAGQNPDRRLANYTPLKRFPCRRLMSTLFVKTDGSVVLCDRNFYSNSNSALANILHVQSLKEAWELVAPKRKAHAEGRYNDAYDRCGQCDDWFIPVD